MSLSPPEYIGHILDEIDYILSRISETDYESFLRDETLKRAFFRSIAVIGEASKKLPEDIRVMCRNALICRLAIISRRRIFCCRPGTGDSSVAGVSINI